MFLDVSGCFLMFLDVSGCLWMSLDVSGCFLIFTSLRDGNRPHRIVGLTLAKMSANQNR